MEFFLFDDEGNADFDNNVARRNVPQRNVRAQITWGHEVVHVFDTWM